MTNGLREGSGVYHCPFCGAALLLAGGEFPFLRSQIVMHLDACDRRPANIDRKKINQLAEDAAERFLSD